jgi:hypothetical protein
MGIDVNPLDTQQVIVSRTVLFHDGVGWLTKRIAAITLRPSEKEPEPLVSWFSLKWRSDVFR